MVVLLRRDEGTDIANEDLRRTHARHLRPPSCGEGEVWCSHHQPVALYYGSTSKATCLVTWKMLLLVTCCQEKIPKTPKLKELGFRLQFVEVSVHGGPAERQGGVARGLVEDSCSGHGAQEVASTVELERV